MKLIKSIENKIEKAKDEIRECHKIISKYDKNHSDLYKKQEKEMKPYDIKIKEIMKKYKPLFDKNSNLNSKWSNKNADLIREIQKLELKKGWVKVMQDDKFTDEDSTHQFLEYLGITRKGNKISIIKKKLSNGIQLIRRGDDWGDGFSAYLFFYGTKLKAYWYRRKAEHQGDETVPYAWVNVEKLVEDEYKYSQNEAKKKGNQHLVTITTTHYGGEFKKQRSPNLNKFKDTISEMIPEKIKDIDLKNKENLKILSKESRY